MCHSDMNGSRGVQYLTLDILDRSILKPRPMKKGVCHLENCINAKSRFSGFRPSICWHYLPRSESEKFLRLNAQSSPLFLSRTYENDCIDFNILMSKILLRETLLNVSRVVSLLCCCLHLYVTYLSVYEMNNQSLRKCCDSPSPADTNGTTGNGNQSRGTPTTSNQNGGNANCGGSNGDGDRNPHSDGNGGCDRGSNSGGGDDGDKGDNKNSDCNSGSDEDGEDEVEERDEEDDDKGNETEEEDIDQDAAKENTEPPSQPQLSLVPEAVIEAAGGRDAIDDDKAKLLVRRVQPIYELVDTEQGYAQKLTFVKEKYIPAVNEESQIEIPDDLAQRWRILWGNWIQLYEWHSNFLNKLEGIYKTDPDRIPKLFIDSRARLRSIYSKYCENQRKATLIADQYRDFFDDLRVKLSDKEDVQSHLMRPVQRIMRYQLPMGEILKLTQRADLPSASQWQKALDLMKEIPKDTQMILEAARIDGFSGTITALGNMRIRGDLQVATISRSEFRARRQVSMRKDKSASVHSGNGPEGTSGLELKFSERRVFLFEQMLLITEEVKSKRKDAFAQSTYLFKNALNVNRMIFEPRLPSDADIDLDDDDLKFLVEDTSPQCDAAYVLDPGSVEIREQWVIQLRDLQRMQHQLLLALQDPKRYVGGGGGPETDDSAAGEATPSPTSSSGAVSGLRSLWSSDRGASKKHGSSKASAGGKKKKFPSFKKGKQRSKTEELPIALLSPGSGTGGGSVDGGADANKGARKESCPNTLHLSVLINPGEKKQQSWSAGISNRLRRSFRVDSRKGNVGSDVHHQASAGALISGRASADLQQANESSADGDMAEGGSASGQQHSHQPSKKKFSVFNLFGKNKHHHHHHSHNQPGTKDQQPSASSPTAGVAASTAIPTSDDLSPGTGGSK